MHQTRFTSGVTASGRSFEFHDDWTKPERSHLVLDEAWVGYTVFAERGVSLSSAQGRERVQNVVKSNWADLE